MRKLPPTPAAARQQGFTLLEVLVVVVIVGILGALALPSFFDQIRKSRRADAITEIYRASQAQERFRASNTAYSANLGTLPAVSALRLFTSTVAITTYNMPSGYYSITVDQTSGVRYRLTATALGSQLRDTRCRTLVMDVNGGTISYTSTNSAATADNSVNNPCWNR